MAEETLEESIAAFRASQPFAPKLTHEQRCAVYALMKYKNVSKPILARAYGISIQALQKMGKPHSGYYNSIKEAAARMGSVEFCNRYITEEDLARVKAVNRVGLTTKQQTEQLKFSVMCNVNNSGMQAIPTIGGVASVFIGIVPVPITYPYRSWGYRILNHPSEFYAGKWYCPMFTDYVWGFNADSLMKWLRTQARIPQSMLDLSNPPDYSSLDLAQIERDQIELAKIDITNQFGNVDWEGIESGAVELPEARSDLQPRT